jgi:hypothetical protein
MSLKVGNIDVLFGPLSPPEAEHSFYNGFNPSTQTLPARHKRYPRSRAFPVATIYERDVEIPMRDGKILRADVFRPADASGPVPALLPWSPYGKTGTGKLPWPAAPRQFADWYLQAERGWKWSQRISVFPLIGCPTTRSLRPLTQPTGRLEGMRSSISMLVDLGIRRVT